MTNIILKCGETQLQEQLNERVVLRKWNTKKYLIFITILLFLLDIYIKTKKNLLIQ